MKICKILAIVLSPLFLITSCGKKKDKTTPDTVVSATVTTSAVDDVTNKAAKCGGNVTDAGSGLISERGICWSTNLLPTITNNPNRIIAGSGTGVFSNLLMENLQPNTAYYVRAYAINEVGTAYGDNVKFTTSPFYSFTYNDRKIYLHPVDNGTQAWGPLNDNAGAGSNTDGKANTAVISQLPGSYAAKTCADLVAYGYSDWYLPSAAELETMFGVKNIGMTPNGDYWSSTETTVNNAVSVNFQTGLKTANSGKDQPKLCRCIRKD